jgi:hypothetical protein
VSKRDRSDLPESYGWLNMRFYESFDPSFLYSKALALYQVLDDKERYRNSAGEVGIPADELDQKHFAP